MYNIKKTEKQIIAAAQLWIGSGLFFFFANLGNSEQQTGE